MTTRESESTPEQLEELGTKACARLLEATEFGRLAVVDEGRPRIIVLNHVVDGPHVLFRSREDSWLGRRTADGRAEQVAYEVDSALPVGRSGWSVIATGLLARETDEQRCERARGSITSWAEGERETILRLTVHELTGRRVGRI